MEKLILRGSLFSQQRDRLLNYTEVLLKDCELEQTQLEDLVIKGAEKMWRFGQRHRERKV